MSSTSRFWCCAYLGLVAMPAALLAAETATKDKEPAPATYTLRYKFQPGEIVRWEVVHQSTVRTSVAGTTQEAETYSTSVKVWRVTDVDDKGVAKFEHRVESVVMRHKLAGRNPVHYNSQTDKRPPPGFEHLAGSVGVPLSIITVDPQGKVLSRQRMPVKAASQTDSQVTIPLPEGPIAVGHTWSIPSDVEVPLENGGIKKVSMVQRLTLQEVKTGVATIAVASQVLTPIHDPAVEARLTDCETAGTVRFDIDAGRVLSQQMDRDKRVIGFRGQASSLHSLTRLTEKLHPAETKVASRPAAEVK